MRLTALLYPAHCILCGAAVEEQAHGICPACRAKAQHEMAGLRCFAPAGIDYLICAGKYANGMKKAVHNMKFQSQRVYIQPLAELMMCAWEQRNLPRPTLITCVPVSLTRMYRRGFNQSAALAEAVSNAWGIPFEETLRRHILSQRQSKLHAQQRQENAEKSFFPRQKINLSGQKVLLIDDVVTTGSTVQVCGALLRELGAEKVYVLAAVRASS